MSDDELTQVEMSPDDRLFLVAMGVLDPGDTDPYGWEQKQERGRRAEILFEKALTTPFPGQPSWLLTSRRATDHEDRYQKKDFVVILDAGQVFPQVKSDVIGLNKFRKLQQQRKECSDAGARREPD